MSFKKQAKRFEKKVQAASTLRLERMWINQPSTLQPYHKLHGVNVLANIHKDKSQKIQVYFTSGSVESMMIDRVVLSEGWQ